MTLTLSIIKRLLVLSSLFLWSQISFAQTQTLSGVVSLPESVLANGDVEITVVLEALERDFNTFQLEVIDQSSTQVSIAQGNDMAGFSLDLPPSITDDFSGEYRIRYGCDAAIQTDCGLLINTSFASASDISIPTLSAFEASITPARLIEIAGSVDLTLLAGETNTLNISTGGVIADSPISVEIGVFLSAIDVETRQSVVIPAGADNVQVDVLFPPNDLFAGQVVSIFTECQTGCGNFTSTRVGYEEARDDFFQSTGTIFPFIGQRTTPFPGFDAGFPFIFYDPNLLEGATLLLVESLSLSGDFLLPRPANSVESQLVLELVVEGFDDNGEQVVGARGDNSIPILGEETVGFSLEVPRIDGVNYRLSYSCAFLGFADITCSDYVLMNLYRSAGPTTFASRQDILNAEQLASITELPIIAGETFSHRVGLETGTADDFIGGIVSVSAVSSDFEFGGSGFGSGERFNFPPGESGVSNSSTLVGIPPLEEPGDAYLIRLNCFSCSNNIPNQFYTPAGTSFIVESSLVTSEQFDNFQVEDVLLRSGDLLQGTISLPSGFDIQDRSSGRIELIALNGPDDLEGIRLVTDFWSIDVANGETLDTYEFAYGPQDSGFYRLEFSCTFSCGDIAPITFYSPLGATTNQADAAIPVNEIPGIVDVELLVATMQPPVTPPTVSAVLDENNSTFSTSFTSPDVVFVEIDHPGGYFQVDTVGSDFNTQIGLYDDQGNLIGGNNDAFIDRLSGLAVLDLAAGTYFLASTEFFGSFEQNFIVVPFDTLATDANLTVNYTTEAPATTDVTVNGTVLLDGTSDQPVGVRITIGSRIFPDDFFITQLDVSQEVTIAAGQTSVPFSIDATVFTEGAAVISYECISNCDGFFSSAPLFASSEGPTQLDDGSTSFSLEQLSQPFLLELPAVTTVAVAIRLPDNQIAQDDLDVFVFLQTFDEQQDFLSSNFQSAQILAGTSEILVDLEYLSSARFLRLSVSCDSPSCGNFLSGTTGFFQSVFVTTTGTTTDFTQSLIHVAQVPETLVAELLEAETITVNGQLPPGLDFANLPGDLEVTVSSLDANGNSVASSFFTFDESLSEELLVVPSPVDRYRISSFCIQNNFLCTGIAVQSDIELQLPNDAPTATLVYVNTLLTPIDVRIPVAIDGRVIIESTLDVLDSFGQVQFSSSLGFSTLMAGETSRIINFQIPEIELSQSYRITYSCDFVDPPNSCADYIADDPSYTITFPSTAIPSDLVFELLPIGLLPDAFEVDNQPAQASTISLNQTQAHTIHEPGDIDWLRFEVLEGDENIQISATAANNGDDRPALVLFDASLTQIEAASDTLSQAENNNPLLSEITRTELPAGIYFVSVQAQSPATDDLSYSITLDIDRPDDELCFPVIAQNGAVALICL